MRLYATALTAVLAGTLLLAAGEIAEAYLKAGPNVMPGGHHRLVSTAGVVDGIASAPTAAYSFRKLKSTYTGSAVRLRRASDSTEQDIGFLGFVPGLGSPFDVAAANAFCAATSCFIAKWYDQSGGARDLVQATAATQPPLVFNCIGTLPCLHLAQNTVAAYSMLTAANYTPSGIVTLNVVARRSAGLGQALFVQQSTNVNRIGTGASANQWFLSPGVTVSTGAADGIWHAALGTIAGVGAGFMNIDGVETAATGTASTLAGPHGISGPTTATAHEVEVIIWDNYNMPAPERAAVIANQRSFWGTP